MGPKLHYTKLTADEQYTHMSLWAMLASPLLIGCDLARLDPFTKSLLTNDEVIAVNQDPLGVHAAAIWEKEGRVIYVKHLEDGAMAVGLFNKTLEPAKIGFTLKQLGIRGTQVVRDLWRQKDLTTTDKGFETQVPPHGVVLVKIAPGNPTRNDLKNRTQLPANEKDTTHVVSFFVCGPPNGKRSAYLRFVPFFPERLCASCWRISSS